MFMFNLQIYCKITLSERFKRQNSHYRQIFWLKNHIIGIFEDMNEHKCPRISINLIVQTILTTN